MESRVTPEQNHLIEQRILSETKKNDNIDGEKNQSFTSDHRGSTEQTSDNSNAIKRCAIRQLKREVMKLYREENYDSALVQCNLLIELCPNNAIFYGSRAACNIKLENYVEALKDAKKSVELDPAFINGHCRVIKSALILHKLGDMWSSVDKLKKIDPANTMLQCQAQKTRHLLTHYIEEVNANAGKNYLKVLEYVEKSLAICPESVVHKVKKAECLMNLQRFTEAEALANEILERDPSSSGSHYVLGRCHFESDLKKSLHHFEEAFRLDPDCERDRELYELGKDFLQKKTEANNAYRAQNFSLAHDLYGRLLQEGRLNQSMMTPLYFHMAQASYELGDIKNCLMECGRVLEIKSDHTEALLLRARIYLQRKKLEKAAEDLENALRIKPSDEALRIVYEKLSLARERL